MEQVDLFAPTMPRVVIPRDYCGDRDALERQVLSAARSVCERLGLNLTAVVCEYVNNHCRVVIENAQGRRVVGTGDCFEIAVASAEIIESIVVGVQPEGDE